MRKILIYITILSMLFCLFSPCTHVYATTEEDNSILDYAVDVVYKLAECVGAALDFASDIKNAFYEYISNTIGADYTEWLKNRMTLNSDGSITVSQDLYNLIIDFINENKTEEVNISDYIYKYYPDQALSASRIPVANDSYNYLMNQTTSDGQAVLDSVTSHKYYWLAYTTSSETTVYDSNGKQCGSAIYAYIPADYENDVIWIRSAQYGSSSNPKRAMVPYTYNSEYLTFTAVPIGYTCYMYAQEASNTGFRQFYGSVDYPTNEYFSFEKYWSTTQYSNLSYELTGDRFYSGAVNSGEYPLFYGPSDSNYPTTGSPYNYYGTVRFPVWQSQQKYVEYMTKFPNYNPEQTVINNEDNSVTITNIYNYTEDDGGGSGTDYSGILEQIRAELSGFHATFNLYNDKISGYITNEIDKLTQIYNRLGNIYDLIEAINNKIPVSSGTDDNITVSVDMDLSEVLELLRKINNKLMYNNVVETLDTIADWLDLFDDDGQEQEVKNKKKLLETALESRFPFSVITTFSALVALLEAEPIEPVFTIPFRMDRFNYEESFVIDLTQFDTLISVLQWFIIIIYIYGLIMLTAKLLHIGGESS